MRFENSIVLRVRERAARALRSVNRIQERMERTAKRFNREKSKSARILARGRAAAERFARGLRNGSQAASRLARNVRRVLSPTRALRAAARGVATSFKLAERAAGRAARVAGRVGRGAALTATRTALTLGSVAVGGIIPAANAVSADASLTAARAKSAGLTVREYNKLLKFLETASSGQLDREAGAALIAEFRNKLGEASQDRQGAAFEGLENLAKFSGERDFMKKVLDPATDINMSMALVLDAMRELAKSDTRRTQFLSEEIFGGEEGKVLNEIATLPKEFLRQAHEQAEKLAIDISPEQIQAVRDYRLALDRLRGGFRATVNKSILQNLPQITATVDNLTTAISRFAASGGAEKVIAWLTSVTENITAFAGDVIDDKKKPETFMGRAMRGAVFAGIKKTFVSIAQIPAKIDALITRIDAMLTKLGLKKPKPSPQAALDIRGEKIKNDTIVRGGGPFIRDMEQVAKRGRELLDAMDSLSQRRKGTEGQEFNDLTAQINALNEMYGQIAARFTAMRISLGMMETDFPSDVTNPSASDGDQGMKRFLVALRSQPELLHQMSMERSDAETGMNAMIHQALASRQQAEANLSNNLAQAATNALNFASALAAAQSQIGRISPVRNSGASPSHDLGGEILT